MVHSTPGLAPSHGYDVCVIGSGPAGITVANELALCVPRIRVCVLESGGMKTTPFADTLRDLDSTGILIKAYSRERVFGGASATWAGLSSPLDEIDFEWRPAARFSGWPLQRDDLIPYYHRASRGYRFPSLSLFCTERWSDVFRAGDFVPEWERLSGKIFLAAQEPQRFGAEFASLFECDYTDLLLDSTAVRLEGSPCSGRVQEVVARRSNGEEFRIGARFFVVACGGIENARLLLLSKYACPQGLGNEKDQVGRYLMNHPKENFGVIVPKRRLRELPAYFGFLHQGFAGSIGLRLSEQIQREQGLLNSYLRLRPVFDWSGRPGVEAAIYFAKQSKLLLRAFRTPRRGRVVVLREYAETGDDSDLQNARKTPADYLKLAATVWRDRVSVLQHLAHRLAETREAPVRTISIRNFMEMEPDPGNRVTLGSRRDAFGSPLPIVDHQPGALDRKTMHRLHDTLREELRRAKWGQFISELRADLEPWPLNLDASHHMGTTRMGRDPSHSVVDVDCKIHTSPNVYVAGASVFPTSGSANPTFTIVALAIRLADHLADRLGRRPPTAATRLPESGSRTAAHG